MKLKIKKSDVVMVIAGNNKGVTGRVLQVYPDKMRILVEQVNVRVKHEKPNKSNQKGGIVHKELPIHYSNVQLLEGNEPTRVGIRVNSSGQKERYSHSTGKVI
jgi:large subunit ribosomal protein L24